MSTSVTSAGIVSGSETVIHIEGHSPVVIDDGALLFGAEFERQGSDLVLSNDGAPPIRVVDYFAQSTLPDLASGEGGLLRGGTVETLAGPLAPGQYAQVRLPALDQPIGQVEALDGSAFVQHADGTVEPLRVGMPVFQNDVVATEAGSALSLTFSDGTIFSLASSSRMVLDQLIYDPAGSANSGAFSLVQGSFVFIAGQVAKTGDMEVTTPAATMGIRGTTIKVDVITIGGETTVQCSLNVDPDGGIGRIEIFDLDGILLETVEGIDSRWVISSEDGQLIELPRSAEDLAGDSALLQDAVAAFRMAIRRVETGETFVDVPGRDGPPQPPETEAEPEPDFNTGAGQELSGGSPPPAAPGVTTEEDEAPESPPVLPTLPPTPPPDSGDDDDVRLETDEDTTIAGLLPGAGGDDDGLTFSLVDGPSSGTLELAADGRYVYVPEENFFGADRFTYAITDADDNTLEFTAAVTVVAVNDLPSLAPGAASLGEDGGGIGIELADLAADIEDGGPGMFYAVVAAPVLGTARIEGTTLIFDPGSDFQDLADGEVRVITFEVSATDTGGAVVSSEVTITVTGSDDAPVLAAGLLPASNSGAPVELDLALLAFDPEDGADGLVYALTSDPDRGLATLDGSVLVFDPGADFQDLALGEVHVITVAVSATDSAGAVAESEVTVTVTGNNTAPVLAAGVLAAAEDDGPVALDLATLAFDAEDSAEALDFALVTAPAGGAATLDSAVLSFDPGADFDALRAGETSVITVEVSATDRGGATATSDVSISVTGLNDAPELAAGALVASEDGASVALDLAALAQDAEDAGDALTYALVTPPAEGTASIDGAVLTFTPGAEFQDLAAGETRVITMEVSATDAEGAAAVNTVSVTVTGTNDAPVADDAALVVAPGGALAGTVTAEDPDSPALRFELVDAPALGTVTLDTDTGAYTYSAAADAGGADNFTVLVSDGAGGSDIATVSLVVAGNDAVGPDGQILSVGIDPLGQVTAGATEPTSAAINIAFVLDSSGSVGATGWTEQTENVAEAIALLALEYEGAAIAVDVTVISYSSGVESTATYDLATETDALVDAVLALEWQAGGTRWDLAFAEAEALFDLQPPDEANHVFFVTDGVPTLDYQAALDSLTDEAANGYSVDIQAFGIGTAPDFATLDVIDSDGAATPVETPADLAEALTAVPVFSAELVAFELSLIADGVDQGVIAGIENLSETGTDYALDMAGVEGIAGLLGETNSLTAVATFDLDGDMSTTDDRQTVATVDTVGRADAAVDTEGGAGGDLIFGSAEADRIGGAAGGDVLIGLEGADTLSGGEGADQVLAGSGDDVIVIDALHDSGVEVIDGGEGRDALKIELAGAIDEGLLPIADISGIEIVDLENGAANTLALGLSDVLDITDAGEPGIGALIDAAVPLLTIYGDAGDSVTLTAEPGDEIRTAGAGPVTDAAGHEVVHYDFVDGAGEILASLAVDADVTVLTASPAH